MSGVSIRPSGNQIAGGDGIPTVEPPWSVGTASIAQPRPRSPSVQVEAAGLVDAFGGRPVPDVRREEHRHRIDRPRREDEDPLAALRKAEGPRVEHPVRPAVAKGLKPLGHQPHGRAARELQHERHVLEQDVRNVTAAQQPEDLADKPRPLALDTPGLAGLREILAWEPGRDEFGPPRQFGEFADIADDRHPREAGAEDGLGRDVPLAEDERASPASGQPELESSDPGKEADGVHGARYYRSDRA